MILQTKAAKYTVASTPSNKWKFYFSPHKIENQCYMPPSSKLGFVVGLKTSYWAISGYSPQT